MISANRIEYNGYSSLDFNLITDIAFDEDSGETNTYLSKEAVASESYRGEFKRIHNFKYTETLTPKFTFIKKDFSDFDITEVRKVLKWLTSPSNASFLSVYEDDSNVLDFEILGGFTEVSLYKLGNGRTVGIVATFESAYPYALSPLKTITKDISNPTDNTITINIDTDEPESAVYPRITIQQNSKENIININHPMTDADNWVVGSVFNYNQTYYWVDTDGVKRESNTNNSQLDTTSVSIRNTYTDNHGKTSAFDTLVKNNVKGEIVVLDGANRVVSSSSTRIFGDDFSWNWLPLYDGKNELSFIGNCSVTIEYREPRKVGEY